MICNESNERPILLCNQNVLRARLRITINALRYCRQFHRTTYREERISAGVSLLYGAIPLVSMLSSVSNAPSMTLQLKPPIRPAILSAGSRHMINSILFGLYTSFTAPKSSTSHLFHPTLSPRQNWISIARYRNPSMRASISHVCNHSY